MGNADIAQLVEQGFCKPQVGSSTLSAGIPFNEAIFPALAFVEGWENLRPN